MSPNCKKLFGFILLSIIVGGGGHLIRVHDRAIPLSEKQISLLNATHYAGGKDIQIAGSKEEKAILEKINSMRAGDGLLPLRLDKSAALLALHHSALMRKQKKLGFDLTGHSPLKTEKTSIGISDTCFYALYADINILRVLEQIEWEEDPLYIKDGLTHIGIGIVHQLFPWRYWATVVYVKRITFLDEFPIYIQRACSTQTLCWKLGENYSKPLVKMTTPAGEVKEQTVKFSAGVYKAEIPFRKQGKYIVEILANGPYGIEVANVLPVYVQVQKEKELIHRRYYSRDMDAKGLEKAMFELINRDRAGGNLKPLQFSSHLCKAARIHSSDMAESGKVVHDLPGCRNMNERLQDARLKVFKQGENIASGVNIEEAQENLMGSPGHRQIILDPDFSHVGVGIVEQKSLLYITQNFASFIPEVSSSEGKRVLLSRINQHRSSPLRENCTLSSIAQLHSEKMARAGRLLNIGSLKDDLSRKVKFQQVSFMVIGAPTIEQIAEKAGKQKNIRSGFMEEMGIGMRQSDDGNLWVTIILKK